MNLQDADKAIQYLVENTVETRKELEDLSIDLLMDKFTANINLNFKGRKLAPMFMEDKKFEVESVQLLENQFKISQKGKGWIVSLTLDEILELSEAGQTQTELKGQYTVGFCK